MKLEDSVQYVKGVGPKRAETLEKAGFQTVEDLLYHLPFRYEDRRNTSTVRDVHVGDEVTLVGRITGAREIRMRRRRGSMLEAVFSDDTGAVGLLWFHQASYFKKKLDAGSQWLVYGRLERGRRVPLQIVHPEIEEFDGDVSGAARIVPVYQKPTDVSVGAMRSIVEQVVSATADLARSAIPDPVRERLDLVDQPDALREVHAPSTDVEVEALAEFATAGHRALIFDELFALQVGMALRKKERERTRGNAIARADQRVEEFLRDLPFEATAAQRRVIEEITVDLSEPRPMNRLVHGDVGSGKTVVAFAAVLQAIAAGYQVAVMAPTELLAEQHFRTMVPWAESQNVRIAMLTGSTRGSVAGTIRDQLAAGDLELVVGTHALVQEGTEFSKLGLAVIDEQHRFGVMQRAALKQDDTDTLLLSATPIPRTLSLTLYGDIDVSFLDEMPAGRMPVTTKVIRSSSRPKLHERMAESMREGTQCYIVYPLVEESESLDLADATTMHEELQSGVFSEFRVGLLHGRMKAKEKDEVMRGFKEGNLDVLVATTVIEVGIDVPNARIMVIEHAERFGLAQLHQLRGRVGRGGGESYCCLVADEAQSRDSVERLRVMEETTDGFTVAEADLKIRGPGEYLGTKQSGAPAFRAANLVRDGALLSAARDEADGWLRHDADLSTPESAELRRVIQRRWGDRLALAGVG